MKALTFQKGLVLVLLIAPVSYSEYNQGWYFDIYIITQTCLNHSAVPN